jgi:THO complex subunit 1
MSDVAVAGVCYAPLADKQSIFSLEALEDPLKSHVQQVLTSSAPPSSKYDTLEIHLRQHLLSASSEDLSKEWDTCWNLCLYILTHSDLNVRKLPFVLLEDLVETLSIETLQQFWSNCIHIHMERLCSGVMWDTDSGNSHVLQWIRLQNALLRRLPNSKGDVLMTMAKILPLSDRSAMKQWGSVAGSPVDYEDDDEYNQDMMMMENKDTALPYSFYEIFWSLQHDMANPHSISFTKFFQSSKTVLAAMESKPLRTNATSSVAHVSTQKYLTRGRLLPLQLQDPSFRACWLTQFCIVVSFVGSQSTSLKTTLTELASRAKQLLTMLPNGESFVKHLEWILNERETMWRAWKKNKCKPDMEPPSQGVEKNDQNEMVAETKSTRVLLETTIPPRHLQLEDLALEKSMAIPNVYSHLEEYVDALDPEAGIDAEYHPKNNANFCWQTLRLLAREHLDCFGNIRHSDGDFERMVRHIYTKRGIDVPGQAPPEEEEHDHDAEREQNVEVMEEHADSVPAKGEETPPVHVAMEDAEEKESAPEEAEEEQQAEDTVEEHVPEPEEEDGPSPKSKEDDDVPKDEEEVSKEEESISPVEPGVREDKAPDDEITTELSAEPEGVEEVGLDDAAMTEKKQDQAKGVAMEEETLSLAKGEEMKQTKDEQSEPLTAFEEMDTEEEALSVGESEEMKQAKDKPSEPRTAFEKMAMEEEALLLAEGEEMKKKLQESADTESKEEPTKPEKPKPNDARPRQDPAQGASQEESKSSDRKRKHSSPVMNESSAKRPRENPRNDNRGRRDDDSRRGGWGPGGGRGPPSPHHGPSHRGGGGRGDGPGMRRGGPPPPRGGRGDDGRRALRGRDARRRY